MHIKLPFLKSDYYYSTFAVTDRVNMSLPSLLILGKQEYVHEKISEYYTFLCLFSMVFVSQVTVVLRFESYRTGFVINLDMHNFYYLPWLEPYTALGSKRRLIFNSLRPRACIGVDVTLRPLFVLLLLCLGGG